MAHGPAHLRLLVVQQLQQVVGLLIHLLGFAPAVFVFGCGCIDLHHPIGIEPSHAHAQILVHDTRRKLAIAYRQISLQGGGLHLAHVGRADQLTRQGARLVQAPTSPEPNPQHDQQRHPAQRDEAQGLAKLRAQAQVLPGHGSQVASQHAPGHHQWVLHPQRLQPCTRRTQHLDGPRCAPHQHQRRAHALQRAHVRVQPSRQRHCFARRRRRNNACVPLKPLGVSLPLGRCV